MSFRFPNRPNQDVNKHLRPISLTPILSKIAEDYVVEEYVKAAVLEKIDRQQFGTIPNSCTTHALISMTHNNNYIIGMIIILLVCWYRQKRSYSQSRAV